ncbi:4'-phosphopantetheinyl transferase family protein [Gloeomargarita lithophora]|nr:4'-phosphopantetheinyl transferase superfamily protein [Gloeomargarita lithophora]
MDSQKISLYRVKMDDLSVEFKEKIATVLSQTDWVTINHLSHPKTRQKLILSRGLLRLLLSHYLRIKPKVIKLAINPWGKLYLPNHALQFNLTHSGCYLVFALSEGYSVGVDVEQIRPLQCPHRLTQRYGTPTEQTHWQTLAPPAQQRYFFELWVAKEAYAKALGTGLTGTLGQFSGLETWDRTEIAPPGGWPAQLWRFTVADDYVGAVCWGITPGADASTPVQTQSVDHFPPGFH